MITDIQKRKLVIENYLYKADVRKWFQFNKPSSTGDQIVHCIAYPLNNGTEYKSGNIDVSWHCEAISGF